MVKGGPSLNPRGRPRNALALAPRVRDGTRNGQDLIDFALAVFHGDEDVVGAGVPLADRWRALEWLADRGYGKAAQIIELVAQPSGIDLARLTPSQIESLERLLADAVDAVSLPDGVLDAESSER